MKPTDGAALPSGLKQISPPLRKDGNIDTLIPVKEKNELRRSVWGMCRGFVTDAVNSAIETGQSQVAARSKQVAFGNRMVIQSFFTQEQLFSFFLPSPGYRSLTLCSSLRRALLMDHGCLLRQIVLRHCHSRPKWLFYHRLSDGLSFLEVLLQDRSDLHDIR